VAIASSRHSLLVLALLAVSGVAIAAIVAQPRFDETCADPRAFVARERIAALDVPGYALEKLHASVRDPDEGSETDRGARRARRSIDGVLAAQNGRGAQLFVTLRRTPLLPVWLQRPTTALPGPDEPDAVERIELEVDGERVPVSIASQYRRDELRFSAHVLAYAGAPISSAFWTRVLETPRSLVSGSRPIEFFAVSAIANPVEGERARATALQFLREAWRHYREVCTP